MTQDMREPETHTTATPVLKPPPGNLDRWRRLQTPPPDALRAIEGGRLKGKTDINPQWRYEALTDVFGPCGFGWRFELAEKWTEPTVEGQVLCFVRVNLFVRIDGQWSEPIPGLGGSMLVENERNGLHADDEAYKKATTDALGTAAKMLGVGASIYRGMADGKYAPPGSGAAPTAASAPRAQAPQRTAAPARQAQARPAQAAAPAPQAAAAGPGTDWKGHPPKDPDRPACPSCGSSMYDLREKARGGKGRYPKKTTNAPDFKCSRANEAGCEGTYWPATPRKPLAESIEQGDPPGQYDEVDARG